jgi:hypothetical protein
MVLLLLPGVGEREACRFDSQVAAYRENYIPSPAAGDAKPEADHGDP